MTMAECSEGMALHFDSPDLNQMHHFVGKLSGWVDFFVIVMTMILQTMECVENAETTA
jgi:hypothetical protein